MNRANCTLKTIGMLTGLLLFVAPAAKAAELRSQSFDRDPGWDAYNNRIPADEGKVIVQDFGYSQTNFAGKKPGEIGGTITRGSKPAFYGARIATKTLNDKLSA